MKFNVNQQDLQQAKELIEELRIKDKKKDQK